jgi:hypothetical protein
MWNLSRIHQLLKAMRCNPMLLHLQHSLTVSLIGDPNSCYWLLIAHLASGTLLCDWGCGGKIEEARGNVKSEPWRWPNPMLLDIYHNSLTVSPIADPKRCYMLLTVHLASGTLLLWLRLIEKSLMRQECEIWAMNHESASEGNVTQSNAAALHHLFTHQEFNSRS